MKRIGKFGILVVGILYLVACQTAPVSVSEIPIWVLDPPVAEDAIYGIGIAKMSTLSTSRTMALSRARDDVARQVEVGVKNAITDYAKESGVDGQEQIIKFIETISRQIANVTLRGGRTEKTEVSKDGTLYALVSYPLDVLRNDAVAEFERSESAAWAEFEAEKALEKLNYELENNPPKAGGK